MLRIYLDWNIFSKLRRVDPSVIPLKNFISEYGDSIVLPYSHAHLSDLQRSYLGSEKGKLETEKDLEFLAELSKGNCLYSDYKSDEIIPTIIDPTEYFMSNYSSREEFSFEGKDLFPEDDKDSVAMRKLWDSLMDMPSYVELKHIENAPKELMLDNYLESSKKKNTFRSNIEDFMRLYQNPDRFNTTYKASRKLTTEVLKISTGTKNQGDPFDRIANDLKKVGINKTFEAIANETLKNSNKVLTHYKIFINYYIQLDLYGYYPDKNATNLTDDAFHSFAAAHCDFYISDDVNNRMKTEAIFNRLGIKTIVTDSKGAINRIRKKILYRTEKSFIEQVFYLSNNSIILRKSFDNKGNPASVHLVEPHLLGFFNRMQITNRENENSFIFYKRNINYGSFYFWTEIENLVNLLIEEFGTDSDRLGLFKEYEKQSILDWNWKGRFWQINEHWINLKYAKTKFGITLVLSLKK